MIRHIVFLFISLFVISCTNEKKNNNDTSREISLVDTKSCSLENVISKMEIIELPRIEDAYIAGYKSFLAKNNLYIFEDKKGTLLVFVSTFAPYRQDTETAFRAPLRME